jgi:hypothetical protein
VPVWLAQAPPGAGFTQEKNYQSKPSSGSSLCIKKFILEGVIYRLGFHELMEQTPIRDVKVNELC